MVLWEHIQNWAADMDYNVFSIRVSCGSLFNWVSMSGFYRLTEEMILVKG